MSSESYAQCMSSLGEDAPSNEMLECVSGLLEGQMLADAGAASLSNDFLLVLSAALVFFMQGGFAMLCAGAVRLKNVRNTMLKNLLDACGAAVAFWAVGYAFAFGSNDPDSTKKTFIGTSRFFLIDMDDLSFWLFQYAFSAASATIVAGTLAERCQMAAYLCYSVMLVGFVYPVIVHSIWSRQGFLSPYNLDPLWGTGVIDFAGTGVVHLTGGLTALFATKVLGPRRGRFHDDDGRPLDKPREFPGHSIGLQMLGVFILWFGWYGFNSGSALTLDVDAASQGEIASLAAVNTTLSGGTAGMVALFVNLYILERYTGEPFFDLKFAMNGTLCGLVAITGGCGVVETWAAVLIGAIAGLIYIGGTHFLVYLRLDDAVDAIPCHMFSGLWGLIFVGLLASPSRLLAAFGRDKHVGWFYSWGRGSGDATLLGIQLIAILWIVGWVMFIMVPFFVWLDWKGWFRSDPLEEIVGLDLSYHGGTVLKDSSVQPEYIAAFNERRQEKRSSGKYDNSMEMASPGEEEEEEENVTA